MLQDKVLVSRVVAMLFNRGMLAEGDYLMSLADELLLTNMAEVRTVATKMGVEVDPMDSNIQVVSKMAAAEQYAQFN